MAILALLHYTFNMINREQNNTALDHLDNYEFSDWLDNEHDESLLTRDLISSSQAMIFMLVLMIMALLGY